MINKQRKHVQYQGSLGNIYAGRYFINNPESNKCVACSDRYLQTLLHVINLDAQKKKI